MFDHFKDKIGEISQEYLPQIYQDLEKKIEEEKKWFDDVLDEKKIELESENDFDWNEYLSK